MVFLSNHLPLIAWFIILILIGLAVLILVGLPLGFVCTLALISSLVHPNVNTLPPGPPLRLGTVGWKMSLLKQLGFVIFFSSYPICYLKDIVLFCDNVIAMYLSSNHVQHQCTKHVQIDLHFVKERVVIEHFCFLHVPSAHQYVDIFTKCLPTQLF